MTNLFISREIKTGQDILFSGEEHHYLSRVLRLSIGDKINLLDGKGGVFLALTREITKKNTRVFVQEELEIDREPGKKIHLLQALPKKDRFEYILEKGTEIGINSFFPLTSQRTIKRVKGKNSSEKLERWKSIIKAAAQQSGRTILPEIHLPLEWNEIREIGKDYDLLLWAWERSENSMEKVLKKGIEAEKILLLIGPEGGFSPEEEEALIKLGFSDFSLGKRILRSDTAGLVAATIILHHSGDLGE